MLEHLKSNLKKSNVYKDTPGGGNSGLPYIKQGLPEDSPAGEYLASIASTSIDTDVRGGLYSTIASTTDTIRVSKFLTDFPRGSAFTSKQIGLQKSNPLVETERRGDVINTQVYNLNSNLLAQVALQGTGQHVPRAGFNTNDLLKDENKYEKIVKVNNKLGQNRLVTLYNTKISTGPNDNNLTANLDKLGISKDSNTLFDYVGGPGSSYGLGNTFIGRAVNTKESFEIYKASGYSLPGYTPIFKTLSQDAPYNSSFIAAKWNTSNGFLDIKDIRDDFNFEDNTTYQQSDSDFIRPEGVPVGMSPINQFGSTMAYSALLNSKVGELKDFRSLSMHGNSLSEDYKTMNMATRVGIGNPGARKDRSDFYKSFKEGQDKINMSPIFKREDTFPIEQDYVKTPGEVRDLIKFCIEAIDNNNPSKTERMHFRAFITNFSDNISADWNGQRYMGRGENFYTYQGFNREVSFTFKIAAQAVEEMEKLYQKLNYLASTLHPDYNDNGFMRGTIHKLTIGEYFYRMPGIIKSMNITVDDTYPWEIKMKQPEQKISSDISKIILDGNGTPSEPNKDQLQMEVPQILNIQMAFTPIYNKLPQRGLKEPIIISDKIDNNYLLRTNFQFNKK